MHNVYVLADRENPEIIFSDHLQLHVLRLSEAIRGRLERLNTLCGDLRHWAEFFIFGANKTEAEMANIVGNDPVIGDAYQAFIHFKSDAELREIERVRQRAVVDMSLMLGEAKKEGREEGNVRGKAETVLKILSYKFGEVPERLAERISAITELGRLDELVDHALAVKSLDELSALM